MFAVQSTGVNTKMQIDNMHAGRVKQNELAQSGGGDVTVPQFQESGLKTGAGPNQAIQQMAGRQLQANAQGSYNHCVSQAAGNCGAMKGGRTRRRYRKKRSRKKKVKKQQK